MSFANKVALITGASSGIGAATALLFAKQGASVAIVGRREDKLKSVASECDLNGNTSLQIAADVSNDDHIKRIIKTTIDKFGKLDILINNAGVGETGTILNGKIMDGYDKINNVNVRSAVHLTTLAAPYLVTSKGCIVNISSIAGIMTPMSPTLAYGMSKAALNHFTKGAAIELASKGVRVNAISPGPVKTEMLENPALGIPLETFAKSTALGRVSASEEIAELVLYLCSEKARGITGSNFVSDNGCLLKFS